MTHLRCYLDVILKYVINEVSHADWINGYFKYVLTVRRRLSSGILSVFRNYHSVVHST